MKALTYSEYGSYDKLRLKEVEKPSPKKNEVLVKVMASSINSWDVDMLKGDTWITRLIGGFFKPSHTILGADISGIIEAVGDEVEIFKRGDEVYGDIAEAGFGGFAEYVAVPEKLLARKPKLLSFNEAASLPQAGLLAVQGLRYQGDIQPKQKVLINGAGGGVGTLALQYVKSKDAEATCVDRKEKFDILYSLGTDHTIDFTTTDYTRTGNQYHKILDVIAHRSTADYKRALTSDGVFAMIGGSMGGLLFRMMVVEPRLSKYRGKKLGIMGYRAERGEVEKLSLLVEDGVLKPVIDSVFKLKDGAEAFRHFISGEFKGKIVIEVGT